MDSSLPCPAEAVTVLSSFGECGACVDSASVSAASIVLSFCVSFPVAGFSDSVSCQRKTIVVVSIHVHTTAVNTLACMNRIEAG